MFKRLIAAFSAFALVIGLLPLMPAQGMTAYAAAGSAEDYSYEITPLLPPFNRFFFVKTDNPDPESFRFEDKASAYELEEYYDARIELDINRYADVAYEDAQSMRVNGGYLFAGSFTDGGAVVLQRRDYYYTWQDTDVTITLPELCDQCDYLLEHYAIKGSFFDNMDAVQSAMKSMSLYSCSYVRGKIEVDPELDWRLSNSPHKDQSFYLYSPYTRSDSRPLLGSQLYPFVYDSLGFPNMMAQTAYRLDSSSIREQQGYAHYLINVTLGGETRSYGGQGTGDGQPITEDKIIKYFKLDGSDNITLDGAKALQEQYSDLVIGNDVPTDNAYTWKDIADTVGDEGAWVKIMGGYAYLFRRGEGTEFNIDAIDPGHSIYWSGDLGYFSDVWMDGRYISNQECFVPGAKFKDYPESDIFFSSVSLPIVLSKRYKYEGVDDPGPEGNIVISAEMGDVKAKNVFFRYDDTSKKWIADVDQYYVIRQLTEQGVIDGKYLDMLELTRDKAEALGVDRNSDIYPETGYACDGSTKPCTPFTTVNGVVCAGSAVLNCAETGAENVTLPDTVTKITDKAFMNCKNLKTLTVPKSVKCIGSSAFLGCEALTDIYFAGTAAEWKAIEIDYFNEILDSAVVHCKDDNLNTTTSTTQSTTASTTQSTTKSTTSSTTQSTTKSTTSSTTQSTTKSTTSSTTQSTTKSTTSSTTQSTTKPTAPIPNDKMIRIAGTGRQQTAALISKEMYSSAKNVFIASGDNSADALAGVPLAYAMEAPILLIRPAAGLDKDTKAEIQRLKAENVYILGGESAVPKSVENEIRALGCKITRIAGNDRFTTAAAIAHKLKAIKGSPSEVFFVYSHNYPDALAVSGVAAVKGAPILYVYSDGDLRASADFLRSVKTVKKAYIIGGYSAIDKAADTNVSGFASVQRVYGDDRYLTCREINRTFSGTLSGSAVCMATGTNFPDALAGGVLAAKTGSPMILVGGSLPDYQKEYIAQRKPDTVYVLGGTGAVSDAVAADAAKAAK